MNKTNIMIVSGFLGSGKTSAILSIAKYLQQEGKKVGIIVNDYGRLAVDTEYLLHSGLHVMEISSGCFCYNLDKFEEMIIALQNKEKLDFILVEPAGSCVDFIATIMKPIKESNHGKWKDYRMLPLSVIADPNILIAKIQEEVKILQEADYIISKQLEEADVIILNKSDILCKKDTSKITDFLNQKYPQKKLLNASVSQSIGIQEWIYDIHQMGINDELYANHKLSISYDEYHKAENAIAWMNLGCEFTVMERSSAIIMVTSLADRIKDVLKESSNELAHLKIYFYNNDSSCKLSCTSVLGENSIDHKLKTSINYGNLLINIRAYLETEELNKIVETALKNTIEEVKGSINNLQMYCATTSNSNPVYRYL